MTKSHVLQTGGLAACALLVLGCGGDLSAVDSTAAESESKSSVNREPPAASNAMIGTGSIEFSFGRLHFSLSTCRPEPYRQGFGEYEYSFAGEGTEPATGKAFRISGHRMLGHDGRQPMTQQSTLLALQTESGPKILESMLYHTDAKGWVAAGGRTVVIGRGLGVEGNSIKGDIPFPGDEQAELSIQCFEL